ncbi:MAG: hypothetical protein FJ212_03535 [Ignavibacteria bacterium]|nr:hypothetical protein [Ignavibacteria bacterium]
MLSGQLFAQQEQITLLRAISLTDSTQDIQSWNYGTDKIANTFLFNSDALMQYAFPFGTEYIVKKRYRGSIMRTNTIAIQDNLTVQGLLKQSLTPVFSLLGQVLYSSRSDSRDIALQSAKRIGGYVGIGYKSDIVGGEVYAGYEGNQQLGINGGGSSFFGQVNHIPISLGEGLLVQSRGSGQFTIIDTMRHMADIDIALNAYTAGDDQGKNSMSIELRSTLLNRDFYSPQGGTQGSLAVEQRQEQRHRANADFGIEIIPMIKADFTLNAEIADIARLFRRPITEFNNTAINRNLQEFTVNVSGAVTYQQEHGTVVRTGFSLFNRDEKNAVIPVFDISQDQLDIIRKQEFQRDNISNRFRIFSLGQQPIGEQDTIGYDISASLLRYDTPSTQNNDDRDEQLIIGSLFWRRSINQQISMSISGGIQQTHVVFLKSERSSLNNRNSSIRLNPIFHWKTSLFEMHPQFEVLANYTIFDFELPGTALRSFSFRQFSYRDSIMYHFRQGWTLESNLFIRRFDRGIMSWSEFSETPVTMSTEQFFKFLMFVPASHGFRIGLGGRFYRLSQEPYQSNVGQSQLQSETYIYGPEMSGMMIYPDGSSISLKSWYEWQHFGENTRRNQINVFLQASLQL